MTGRLTARLPDRRSYIGKSYVNVNRKECRFSNKTSLQYTVAVYRSRQKSGQRLFWKGPKGIACRKDCMFYDKVSGKCTVEVSIILTVYVRSFQ